MDKTGARGQNRNCTVAVTGKTFEPLEKDETRKQERSASLPPVSNRRGDIEISAETVKKLGEAQTHLKGRVRRGSIFIGSIPEEELVQFWDLQPKVELNVHGKLSSNKSENVAGMEREAVLYKCKNPTDLKDKYRFIYSCTKGSKGYNDTSPNQDNFSLTVFDGWQILIVMDGHGPMGHYVSARVVDSIPYYLCKSDLFACGDYEAALVDAFKLASQDLLGFAIERDIDVQASGSTCVLFMNKGDVYYTANVGDSRVVIGYEDDKEVVFETLDHKPGLAAEKARIVANGGEIKTLRYDDFTVDRIFVAGGDYPGLCMSRSFGDECVKQHGVISEPEVSGPLKLNLSRNPFIVVASDGVWEFIDSAWCVKALVKKLANEAPERIVQKLSKEARRRWKAEEGEYCDDITVCLMQLGNAGK